jgi:DNA-binding NarL/FixJ family response regulator
MPLYINSIHLMKVMIVDDSILLQTRLSNALRRVDENMSISGAGNCKEAIDLFSHFNPDTVILDIALPDGSGINLLQRFKKEAPAVHVIMLTNYPTDEFIKNCMELGADYFFDKSNMKGLINIIKYN